MAIRLNNKVNVSSARFQNAMIQASAFRSASYQLFMSLDDSGKPYNPVGFRLAGANGGIDGAIAALMAMDFDDANDKTRQATGVKLSYPTNTLTRIKVKLGTWINPRRLAAIVHFLNNSEKALDGMDDKEYREHLESAELNDLILAENEADTEPAPVAVGQETETQQGSTSNNPRGRAAKVPVS